MDTATKLEKKFMNYEQLAIGEIASLFEAINNLKRENFYLNREIEGLKTKAIHEERTVELLPGGVVPFNVQSPYYQHRRISTIKDFRSTYGCGLQAALCYLEKRDPESFRHNFSRW